MESKQKKKNKLVNWLLKLTDGYFRWLFPTATATLAILEFYRSCNCTGFNGLCIESCFFSGWLSVLFFVAVVLTLFFSLVQNFRQSKISQLEENLLDAEERLGLIGENVRLLFDGYLAALMRELDSDFTFVEPNESRLSLYITNPTNYFVPCGRVSENPAFQFPGRTSYPPGQGCIGICWSSGWHFVTDLPAEQDAWLKIQKEQFGINKAIAKKMKMPSRTYAALRIQENSGTYNNVAVLVLESVSVFQDTEEKLRKHLEGEADYIAQLITNLKEFIPTPDFAKEAGF